MQMLRWMVNILVLQRIDTADLAASFHPSPTHLLSGPFCLALRPLTHFREVQALLFG